MTPKEFRQEKFTPEKSIEETKQEILDKVKNFEFNEFQKKDLINLFEAMNSGRNINKDLINWFEKFGLIFETSENKIIKKMNNKELKEIEKILNNQNEEE